DQRDPPVLEGAPAALAPIEVLEPLHARRPQVIKAADSCDGPAEPGGPIHAEELRQVTVDRPPLANTGNHNTHGVCRASSSLWEERPPAWEVGRYPGLRHGVNVAVPVWAEGSGMVSLAS